VRSTQDLAVRCLLYRRTVTNAAMERMPVNSISGSPLAVAGSSVWAGCVSADAGLVPAGAAAGAEPGDGASVGGGDAGCVSGEVPSIDCVPVPLGDVALVGES
jgi:hypothetical protein